MRFCLEKKRLEISVGELLDEEFGKITGVLTERLKEGALLHTKFEKSLEEELPEFEREKKLEYEFNIKEWEVRLYGRCDGLVEKEDYVEVHEIKTVILDAGQLEALNMENYPRWRYQIAIYGYLSQRIYGKPVKCYLHIIVLPKKKEKVFEIQEDIESVLLEWLEKLIMRHIIIHERKRELNHYIKQLDFPYETPRKNQVKIFEILPLLLKERKRVLIEAPSGTGKTAAILFPVIKYAILHDLKIYYLTAKNTQQREVFKFLRDFDREEKINVVQVTGKEKLCRFEYEDCERCLYAKRLPEEELRGHIPLDRLMKISEKYNVCPYILQFQYLAKASMVVCDYNYVLKEKGDFILNPSRSILVFDEAHNLPERFMELNTFAFTEEEFYELRKDICFYPYIFPGNTETILNKFKTALFEGDEEPVIHFLRKLKNRFYKAYEISRLRGMGILEGKLLDFMGRLETLKRLMKTKYGIVEIPGCNGVEYFPVETGKMLDDFWRKFYAVVGFSSTLSPPHYYLELLGFSGRKSEFLRFEEEFPHENRKVVIIPEVSTLLRDRAGGVKKLARIIENVVEIKPGNYIVFLPSREYLELLVKEIRLPLFNVLVQKENMSLAEREKFLKTLAERTRNVVFAVSGGIFSEGVDYPGKTLDGVIVVSPSLPQVTPKRELLKRYFDEKYGEGFKYAYIIPGMRRVLQAAGRVIRSYEDRGIIVFVGRRFTERDYIELLPSHWYVENPYELITSNYIEEIRRFWNS